MVKIKKGLGGGPVNKDTVMMAIEKLSARVGFRIDRHLKDNSAYLRAADSRIHSNFQDHHLFSEGETYSSYSFTAVGNGISAYILTEEDIPRLTAIQLETWVRVSSISTAWW